MRSLVLTLLATLLSGLAHCAEPPRISPGLPTDNDFLFRGRPEKFYMYCYRNFEGKESRPWTAGRYGFVRTMRRTKAGVIGTKFHEGIDIKPLNRDAKSNPTDLVRPILPGIVVYVNPVSGRSNYGQYVVIRHDLAEGSFYSLYAHLNRVDCKVGGKVNRDSSLGLLGYTGRGINRERAHVHVEFNILCSERYTAWHKAYVPGTNYHGKHNGFNLSGLDIGSLLLESNKHGSVDFAKFIASQATHYKVTVPRKGHSLPILDRYPYLRQGDPTQNTPSWEISLTASGFPLAIRPSNRRVSKPIVSWVKYSPTYHKYQTIGRIEGSGNSATLTGRGLRYIELLTDTFPAS